MSARNDSSLGEVTVRKLEGPPEPGFDCGHSEQNAFLYEHAWRDQQELVSVTYQYFVDGIFAGFATVSMDGLALTFRERGPYIRYETVGATKLAQLGVDVRFQGRGLGETIVADVIARAQKSGERIGCRFVAVDARPGLDGWYERLAFKRNKLMQQRMAQLALEKKRDVERLATSMRFDIRNS
ncbi:MAG TPA: GNAT family N-acetyltransferase [Longimicrobium sp.]|nr:GNAT family N-acetyltransferase [Longimicrobium sp.]